MCAKNNESKIVKLVTFSTFWWLLKVYYNFGLQGLMKHGNPRNCISEAFDFTKAENKKKNVVIHCVGQFLGSTIISWAPPIFSPLAALAPRPLAGLAPDDWDPAASDAG